MSCPICGSPTTTYERTNDSYEGLVQDVYESCTSCSYAVLIDTKCFGRAYKDQDGHQTDENNNYYDNEQD